ncbi:RING-type E3 ubiquitin transferase [Malassezia nana]|uniref:RING-type E3 ubiquitin transferase n=1 Tax=Malassezia nana TaxID=180528 RepID=A0AAF0EF65_9BASI|nr:RING-type E3 ubiquitin transferase [Malassezia nana]
MLELAYSLYTKTLKLVRFRAATRHMEKRYPAVPDDQIAEMRDRTCIVCREEFVTGAKAAMDVPRKLSCGHVFHHRCLHSWLERQQSCPTCRKDVLETNDTLPPASDPLNQQAAAENQERALEAPQADAEQRPEPQETQDSPSTLQALIHRYHGPETSHQHPTPAQSAHDLLQEVRPGLADQLVQSVPKSELDDAPSENVREAVRRATLERYSQTVKKQPDQPNSKSPVLIPLFDPAQIPDFAQKHQSQLPYPLADWIPPTTHSRSMDSREPAGSMKSAAPLEAQIQEKLAALQEAEALIERAKAQLQTVLGSTEAPMKGKARDEPTSSVSMPLKEV